MGVLSVTFLFSVWEGSGSHKKLMQPQNLSQRGDFSDFSLCITHERLAVVQYMWDWCFSTCKWLRKMGWDSKSSLTSFESCRKDLTNRALPSYCLAYYQKEDGEVI